MVILVEQCMLPIGYRHHETVDEKHYIFSMKRGRTNRSASCCLVICGQKFVICRPGLVCPQIKKVMWLTPRRAAVPDTSIIG
jgi:hypothetical protein